MKRLLIITMVLFAALLNVSAAEDVDTSYNAARVTEEISIFLTRGNFGKCSKIERNKENTWARTEIEFPSEKGVGKMLYGGFPWQFEHVIDVYKDKNLHNEFAIYQVEYMKHRYYVKLTYETTGHDSAYIYVDVDKSYKDMM